MQNLMCAVGTMYHGSFSLLFHLERQRKSDCGLAPLTFCVRMRTQDHTRNAESPASGSRDTLVERLLNAALPDRVNDLVKETAAHYKVAHVALALTGEQTSPSHDVLLHVRVPITCRHHRNGRNIS